MSDTTPVVYVVDDDISVRESVETMVAEAGFPMTVQAMKAGAIEFLTKPYQLLWCSTHYGIASELFTANGLIPYFWGACCVN